MGISDLQAVSGPKVLSVHKEEDMSSIVCLSQTMTESLMSNNYKI